jgi:hypothetical protein
MLQDLLDNLANNRTDLDIIIEQFRFAVVAGLSIVVIEDMREEYNFELIEVEGLGDVQQ